MLKFITEKLLGQILPSVVATVIGAYVVNQYIVARPDAPPPAAPAAQLDAGKAAKPVEPVAAAISPEPAKSELVRSEPPKLKPSVDKEKSADKPVGRHQISVHDKAPAAKPAGAPVSTASAAPEPVKPPEERTEPARDPNQVLRAAVERLRASASASAETPRAADTTARAQEPLKVFETPRAQEPPRLQETARATAPALPPAVNLAPSHVSIEPYPSSPATTASVPVNIRPADTADLSDSDPHRPTPPADIPAARTAASGDGTTPARKPSVAEDVLFTAKSVIHSVLPR
ncbi:MAG: hypothetical protein ACOY6K_19970 [Pseudomonadota bacterium]